MANIVLMFILLFVLGSICFALGYNYGSFKTSMYYNSKLRKIDAEMCKLGHSIDDLLHKLIVFKIIESADNDKQ